MSISTSRALAAGAVLSLGVAACGGDDQRSAPAEGLRAPVPIEVGAVGVGAGTAEAAMAGDPSDRAAVGDAELSILPYFGGFEYEVGEGLPPLPTLDTGYEFPSGPDVDAQAVSELASALGVEGEPVRGGGRDADDWSLWRVGPDDGTAPSLTVTPDGQLSWYFSSAWATLPADDCEYVLDDDGEIIDVVCPEPVPPTGVPTESEARALVDQILADLGVDAGGFDVETYADEWSASVTLWPVRDGIRWPMSWGFGFGADATLQWASGALAEPVPAGPYPLIDLETAIERLEQQGRWWGGVAAIEPGVIDPELSDTDTIVSDRPEPEMQVPEMQVAVLADVRADLWWVWDTDGSVWLLPAYTFTDAEGLEHTVPAVTDEFIELDEAVIEPLPADPPLPVEPLDPVLVDPIDPADPAEGVGSDDDVTMDEPVDLDALDTDAIVGATVADAEAELEARGLTMRVIRLDGEDLMATMDFVPTRVNVAVEGDVVVDLISAG
jgi:hypothetical protein